MNPICFALDGMLSYQADVWIEVLEDHVGAFKCGLELFIRRAGLGLPKTKRDIVLDLKLHDIPETVANAVAAGGDLGAKYMTLHIQQRKALEQAVKAAEPYGITLLGVTVLTSMNDDDNRDLGYVPLQPSTRVTYLADFAHKCGIRGFVCSPQEVSKLKGLLPDSFFLVPGIRPKGSNTDDQKRVGTPGQAVKDGANLLVIGRPIRDAAVPLDTVANIMAEINGAS